jgi:small subunit ribosomal protein S6
MHCPAPRSRVVWDRIDGVDRRFRGLELVPLVHDRPGFLEPLAQLLGPRIHGLDIHPARGPAPDRPPERGHRHGDPTEKREAAAHEADATLPAASCPAAAQRGRLDRRKDVLTPYEILLMLDPELPEERQSEIVTRTRELIERGGGSWDAHDVWGRRKLAYEIDHKTDGVYHLLTFSAEPETLDEVSRVLKITDGVMRHMAVRRSERRPAGTVASPSEDRQDGPEPATVAVEEE